MVDELTSYESLVVRILADRKTACAAEIAAVLYPGEVDLRPKTSQVSVVLRRLEKKGMVLETGKDGKRVSFKVCTAEPEENTAVVMTAPPEERESTVDTEDEGNDVISGEGGWPKVWIFTAPELE
jgi:predicted transcriptional regulator